MLPLSLLALALGLAAGAILAAWLLVRLWRLDPAWVMSLALVAFMFSGNWGLLPVAGSLPVPPDRLLFVFAIAIVLLRLRDGRLPDVRWSGVHLCLAAIAVYGLVSLIWTTAADQRFALFSYIDAFGVFPFVAFVVAPSVFHSARQRSILLTVLTCFGAYLGLTALFEALGADALLVPRYIGDPEVGIHYGRARGPFVQAAAMGLASYGCAVAAALASVVWQRRGARWFARVVVLLCLVGSFLTLTRAVWIATVAGTFIALLTLRRGRRIMFPLFAAGAIGVLAALAVLPGLADNVRNRQQDQRPVWDRYNTNRTATVMIEDRPLFGVGWGAFRTASIDYARQSERYPLTGQGIPVHNVFLSYAVELGVPGAALWLLAWMAALVGSALRRPVAPGAELWRAGMIALLLHWFTVANFTPVAYPLPIMLLWLWAGVLWGQTRPCGSYSTQPGPSRSASRISALRSASMPPGTV